MAFYTILFSPCGGTRRIAEILEREWKEEQRICIDLCDPQVTKSLPYFKEDDTCIIAMPSYGGRAPQTALQRLRVIHGNHASAILVCSYGNRAYEDTLLEMKECAQESGLPFRDRGCCRAFHHASVWSRTSRCTGYTGAYCICPSDTGAFGKGCGM